MKKLKKESNGLVYEEAYLRQWLGDHWELTPVWVPSEDEDETGEPIFINPEYTEPWHPEDIDEDLDVDEAIEMTIAELHGTYGLYGRQRLEFLKEYQRPLYDEMRRTGTLHSHLVEADRRANDLQNTIVKQMAAREGTNEALKARDPMRWVGLMNNYAACAREMVRMEVIYPEESE